MGWLRNNTLHGMRTHEECMKQRKKNSNRDKKVSTKDPLLLCIERALCLGRFITYNARWDFVHALEEIKAQLDDLIQQGDAARTVKLFELFIAGCYEKMNEVDDSSGNMGMFWEELFCSWIVARQEARCDAEETVRQMLKWMDNDDYGVCYKIEDDITKVLGKKEMICFEEMILQRFEKQHPREAEKNRIHDFSYVIRKNAEILKAIYCATRDADKYSALCEKTELTPKDCERIAHIYKAKKEWATALRFVDQGLSLEKEKSFPNYSGFALSGMRKELLNMLGRKDEAFETAWNEFAENPDEYGYEEFMKYIHKKDKAIWHKKALEIAQQERLDRGIIQLLLKVKGATILAERIIARSDDELEALGYYALKDAAKKLAKNHWFAAAKLYRAMGMEIVNKGKRKYYKYALQNFKKTKELYLKADSEQEWLSIVELVQKKHSRKYAFIEDFNAIAAGEALKEEPSFLEVAAERWQKQVH